ncbi:MAG: Cna B-type domain-containing protein [Ruminococcaceae bacterium]|nr:Cna B-type domain-containing protein [Oscillospiraceae bacterium]
MKRKLAAGLVLLLVFALGFGAFAAENATLTVHFHHEELNIPGCEFSVYRVADFSEKGEFTYTAEYSSLKTDISHAAQEDWKALEAELSAYISANTPAPLSVLLTGEDGKCTWSGLERGLYYIVGKPVLVDGWVYAPMPILIALPNRSSAEGEWEYQVDVSPKYSRETEKTDLRVKKVWADSAAEDKRPVSVTVDLLRDGEVFDTVVLESKNNWEHIWTGLEAKYTWTVEEKAVSGYSAQVRREGNTFFVTNTPTQPPPPPPELPPTGQLWWPVPLLAIVGLGLIIAGLACRRKEK